MFQLQDYGQGLHNGKMGNFHSFEGDILLTAREEALLRAATMNNGPEERNSRPIIRGRSGMRHLWTRWPGGVLRYQFKDSFSNGQRETVRRVLQEFEAEISSAFPPVQKCVSFREADTGSRVLLLDTWGTWGLAV